jgi:cyclase
MLKRRLIPKLQMKRRMIGRSERLVLVTTVQFSGIVEIGDPVSQAKIYQAQAADELIFLDLDATLQRRAPGLDVLRKAAEEVFMPITAGGGVTSVAHFQDLLGSGADKVCVNTGALARPELISDAAMSFGSQCVVASIDFRRSSSGIAEVWSHCASRNTHREVVAWALECEKLGAGEILLTSVDRDGSRNGLDNDLTRQVVENVSIPVITSGGCGLATHFVEGFTDGRADAVAAGTFFCLRDQSPMQARARIKNAGIAIRIHT